MSETPAAGETAAAIEPKVRSGLSEWLGREAHGSSIQLSRTEIIRLQKAIAEGRAPKPPVDGTKCWQSEDKGLRLHIRLYDSGRGIWFTNYDTPRRRGRSWKIGNAANLNTTVAEKAATQIQARVALGADPQVRASRFAPQLPWRLADCEWLRGDRAAAARDYARLIDAPDAAELADLGTARFRIAEARRDPAAYRRSQALRAGCCGSA